MSGTPGGTFDAVVVGRTDLGEADRVVRLLCAEHGRVDAVARGARRSARRFGGLLDPGTRVVVTLRRGKGSLAAIEAMDLRAAPRRAREDLHRIALLAYGCELVSSLAPAGIEAERQARLLDVWLDLLEEEPPLGVASRLALEAKALTFAGIGPSLLACCRCGRPLEGEVTFEPDGGGGAHLACARGPRVAAEVLGQLEILRRTPLVETRGLPPPSARWLLADFIEHHLARPLRSRRMVAESEAMGDPRSGG